MGAVACGYHYIGAVGFALGPLVVAAALAPLGLHGTLVIAVVPFAAAAAVAVALRRFREKPAGKHGLPRPAAAPPETIWSLRVEAEH